MKTGSLLYKPKHHKVKEGFLIYVDVTLGGEADKYFQEHFKAFTAVLKEVLQEKEIEYQSIKTWCRLWEKKEKSINRSSFLIKDGEIYEKWNGVVLSWCEKLNKKFEGAYFELDECFVATAVDADLTNLRSLRNRLRTYKSGRVFIYWYYRLSPPLAKIISNCIWLKKVVRGILYPLI